MELYCACGYAIFVSAKWDGQDFHLVLHDSHAGAVGASGTNGTKAKESTPITRCPRCLRRLDVGDLDRLPPSPSLHPSAERERAG